MSPKVGRRSSSRLLLSLLSARLNNCKLLRYFEQFKRRRKLRTVWVVRVVHLDLEDALKSNTSKVRQLSLPFLSRLNADNLKGAPNLCI